MNASASHATLTIAPKHANPRAVVNRRFGGLSVCDPRFADLHASTTATALDMAAGIKRLALAGGISGKRASAWRKEGRGNPLFEVTELVGKLAALNEHPGAIVAHVSAALHHGFLSMTKAQLVDRFWELMAREAEKEGRENGASQTFARTGDLSTLRRTMLEEAGVQQEIAAVALELERLGVDPVTYYER
jgi:hypothetical protein